MESKEHHDLHGNDIQDFFENFGSFWKTWGNTLLTVIAVVVIIFAGTKLYRDWRANAQQAAWTDLAGATSPQAADMVASDHSNPAVKALAFLKAGDLYLQAAAKPAPAENRAMPVDAGAADPVEAQRKQMLDSAETRYKTVLSLNAASLYQLNAQLGLASVAEGRKDWEQARTYYQQVIDEAGDKYAALKELATIKQGMLPNLESPIVFGPSADALADAPPGVSAPGSSVREISAPDMLGPVEGDARPATIDITDPLSGLDKPQDNTPAPPSMQFNTQPDQPQQNPSNEDAPQP